jgi:hypothetical protein
LKWAEGLFMGRYPTYWIVAGFVWQGLIVAVAATDALYSGLPAAFFAVAWLVAIAGPIALSRRQWSAAKSLCTMAGAGGLGLIIGVTLYQVSPTPALAAECLSFGFLSVIFSIAASLPAAVRFAVEGTDGEAEAFESTEPCGSVGHASTAVTAAAA